MYGFTGDAGALLGVAAPLTTPAGELGGLGGDAGACAGAGGVLGGWGEAADALAELFSVASGPYFV